MRELKLLVISAVAAEIGSGTREQTNTIRVYGFLAPNANFRHKLFGIHGGETQDARFYRLYISNLYLECIISKLPAVHQTIYALVF